MAALTPTTPRSPGRYPTATPQGRRPDPQGPKDYPNFKPPRKDPDWLPGPWFKPAQPPKVKPEPRPDTRKAIRALGNQVTIPATSPDGRLRRAARATLTNLDQAAAPRDEADRIGALKTAWLHAQNVAGYPSATIAGLEAKAQLLCEVIEYKDSMVGPVVWLALSLANDILGRA